MRQRYISGYQLRFSLSGAGRLCIALLVGCLFFSHAAQAQLSGSYTICGSGSCNYSKIGDAVSDLTSKGVSGPVVFYVSSGTYNEAITIGAITGASSKNTISFIGAGRTKSIIQNTAAVLTLNTNCAYVSFNGFGIANTSSAEAVYATYCSSCSVLNCNLSAAKSCCGYVLYDYYNSHFTVSGCHISGGYYGIYIASSQTSSTYSGGVYSNNRIVQFAYYGMYIYYSYFNQYTGNVVDSSANGYGYGILSIYETGAQYLGNKVIAPGLYYPFLVEYPNYISSSISFVVANNFFSNYQVYVYFYLAYCSNVLIAHNTMYGNTDNNAMYMELYYCSSNINFISNILYGGGSNPTAYFTIAGTVFPVPFGVIDGNDYVNPYSSPLVYFNGNTYNTIAAYQSFMSSYIYTSPYNGVKKAMESSASNFMPKFINAPSDLHVSTTSLAPSGVYAGIGTDIDGNTRCKLFPTAGAVESSFGKGVPTSKLTIPTGLYPNSPAYFYQTYSVNDPVQSHWYLNGVHVSDSIVLKTSALVAGQNCLKLVQTSCSGSDSVQKCFTVTAPTAVPATAFTSNLNIIRTGQVVNFTDLSTNGPTKWLWTVTPDSILSTTTGKTVPAITWISGNNTSQNPQIQFNYQGKYTICLTAYNGVGQGSTKCDSNDIVVTTSVNLGPAPQTITAASGYLYDNGGPNGNYNYDATNNYVESALIDPCADSVYMTLSQFDLYCGYDYLRIYSGKDKTGKPLWNSTCNHNGYVGLGPGYTGGKFYSCMYQCMPNVTKPDTFKAKNTMYIEMVCFEAYQSAGFAAYWWSKPKTATRPKASFATSDAGDSVCTNGSLTFYNTTKIDPKDPASFLWDLDGDLTTFECAGACDTVVFPYFLPGKIPVTLIATNCGGSDTAVQEITIYNPKKPAASFTVDNNTPTTNDVIFFTSTVPQCVDDYKWTIIKTSTGSAAAVSFVNGTTNLEANPQVNIADTGYFSVTLTVDNVSGSDKITRTGYIFVRNPYCIPSVVRLLPGLGISKVVFNTIDNSMPQATQAYANYAVQQGLGTTVAQGAPYTLSISRDSTTIYDAINRDVYIDWNQDGSFVGPGEIVAQDSNSLSQTITKKITVPKTAKLGATVMRIAVNLNIYSNKPCGENEFGAYQDYRLYVTPYNVKPVITLKGPHGPGDTIKIEQGYQFVDSGYTASSILYGDITKKVIRTSREVGYTLPSDSFSNIIPGTYVFYYNVTDSSGNKAMTQYRIVKVTYDKTPPKLIVGLPDTVYMEINNPKPLSKILPKPISAFDLIDGNLVSNVTIDTAAVQKTIPGVYAVGYSVMDLSNNDTVVYRYVDVLDTIKPVLTLNGKNPYKQQVFMRFKDPGVTITDKYYTTAQLQALIVVQSNIDSAVPGSYKVYYSLTDPSGNVADTIMRTVIVTDTVPPLIRINGPATDSVAVFTLYYDSGATVSDNYYKTSDLKTSVSGSYYKSFPMGNPDTTGIYQIVYTVTDPAGNKASATRIVKVQDRTAPVITLRGDLTVSLCRWARYQDSGYVVKDNYDPIGKIKIDTLGNFYKMGGTNATGLLTIRYQATDRAGNVGVSDARTIWVMSETDAVCLSGIDPGIDLDKSVSIFPNPGSGTFEIRATLPAYVAASLKMTITDITGKEIAQVQNGAIDNGTYFATVNLGAQAPGIYLLKMVSGNRTVTKRIIIAR